MLRLTGVVIHGQGKGGPAGFTTANLCRDAGEALPENGVYAALARLEDGKTYLGVTNVGTRPTADDSARVTIETLLIGYAGDLYGRRMTLDIVGRIRDIRRFESMEALRLQIAQDRQTAARLLRAAGIAPDGGL